MDEATAEDINNYIVDQGAVFLNSAELLADRKTVVLTPGSSLAASALVQPVNLNDLAGNALAATLGLTITVPQPDGLSFLYRLWRRGHHRPGRRKRRSPEYLEQYHRRNRLRGWQRRARPFAE